MAGEKAEEAPPSLQKGANETSPALPQIDPAVVPHVGHSELATLATGRGAVRGDVPPGGLRDPLVPRGVPALVGSALRDRDQGSGRARRLGRRLGCSWRVPRAGARERSRGGQGFSVLGISGPALRRGFGGCSVFTSGLGSGKVQRRRPRRASLRLGGVHGQQRSARSPRCSMLGAAADGHEASAPVEGGGTTQEARLARRGPGVGDGGGKTHAAGCRLWSGGAIQGAAIERRWWVAGEAEQDWAERVRGAGPGKRRRLLRRGLAQRRRFCAGPGGRGPVRRVGGSARRRGEGEGKRASQTKPAGGWLGGGGMCVRGGARSIHDAPHANQPRRASGTEEATFYGAIPGRYLQTQATCRRAEKKSLARRWAR